jgi:hypothetical protein
MHLALWLFSVPCWLGYIHLSREALAREKERSLGMAEVTYLSRVKVEPIRGFTRQADIPAEEKPVLYGVHSEIAEHYGVSPGKEEPHASTLDHLVAAAGG